MKIPRFSRGVSPKRTVQGILDDHSSFLSDGGGDARKAKEFNNCVSEPFFNIPLFRYILIYSHLYRTQTYPQSKLIGVLARTSHNSRRIPKAIWTLGRGLPRFRHESCIPPSQRRIPRLRLLRTIYCAAPWLHQSEGRSYHCQTVSYSPWPTDGLLLSCFRQREPPCARTLETMRWE